MPRYVPKPGPDHPWNVRAHASAVAAPKKRKRGNGSRDCHADTFTRLREEEDLFEREEANEIERSIREYLG